MNSRVQNLKSTVISNFWGKLEQVSFDFIFKNGISKHLTHEVYGRANGVAVLLYNSECKKVILCKQFRAPMYVAGVKGGNSIEVSGGVIDVNETPEIAIIRETEEEIGYRITNLKKVSTVFLSPGLLKEQVSLFVAEYNDKNKIHSSGGGLISENEEIEVLEMSYNKALQMIDNGEIIDSRTIILLYYLKMKNLIL